MKRRFWLFTILMLIAAGLGGTYYYQTTAVVDAQVQDAPVQTSVARLGDITISATGAGTIIAASDVALSFEGSGTLAELLVNVGDRVNAGDVLARIDNGDARQALLNAQIALAQARMQGDATATQTGISYADIEVEQARLNLSTAETAYDQLLAWTPDPDAIAASEASLAAAQASLNAAWGQEAASGTNIEVSGIALEQAQRALAEAQEAYDVAYQPARDWELNDPRQGPALENERARTADNLLRAQEALQVAQLNYDATVAGRNYSSSTGARANVLNAEQALAAAQVGPTDDELAAAQTAVRQAELTLQRALLDQEADALSLAQAELNVAAAEAAVAATVLYAPVAGTVTAVTASVGETAPAGVIVLADLEQPLVELFLDESDLNMAGLDYAVELFFDALPEETFTGRIIQIDPQLTVSNGISVLRAIVRLDADSFAKPQTLPVGLNATVDVIGGRTENAVLVPVEALRELTPGQYSLFVMENGEPTLRFVEVGLMDFTFAEILSGIEAGEIVTTGIVETQ